MGKRFATIWFRYLRTDWFSHRHPNLSTIPFVLVIPDHGRVVVAALNKLAEEQGIFMGMAAADARAMIPSLQCIDDKPRLAEKLLGRMAEWCIRFSPAVAVDMPDGLILDLSGCAHLWGSEEAYLTDIITRLNKFGFDVRGSIADTIGAAWAFSRFGKSKSIVPVQEHINAIRNLPAAALRLSPQTHERLIKLGLRHVKNFIDMPTKSLRRRFGDELLQRLKQITGQEEEIIESVQPLEPYQERLPCLEPILTATGIEIALQRLLETLCTRLKSEAKGIRKATFKAYRLDGKIESIEIGTNRPTHNATHLFKLFEIKISTIEPALGIELFILEANKVDDAVALQDKLWSNNFCLEDPELTQFIDRLSNKIDGNCIRRYLPDEHYWPERSVKIAQSFNEKSNMEWKNDKPRPIQLLDNPEPVEVMALIPDYPPTFFRHKGKLHIIKKADGPERIEREWWIEEGLHRDYYCVEDEEGQRYWLFRSGHYEGSKNHQWFLHGFFA